MFNYAEVTQKLKGRASRIGITLGCDPEMFLVDGDGTPVSAIGLIGAGKDNPKQLEGYPDGYAIQEDNVAVEYNIPPAEGPASFSLSVCRARDYVTNNVAEKNGLRISTAASLLFPTTELQNPAAQEFGCDPDFNVYDLVGNPPPKARDKTLRSAGGHFHIGMYTDGGYQLSDEEKILVAQILELFVGTSLAILDKDKRRMKLYGKAGAVRLKPYGFEYRTPSNLWSFLTHSNIALVASTMFEVLGNLDYYSKHFNPRYAMLARAGINTGNKKLLQELWDVYLKEFGAGLHTRQCIVENVNYVASQTGGVLFGQRGIG